MIAVFRRLVSDSSGNTAIIFALLLLPLIFMTGMGSDYALAALRQNQLNAIADAAALAAVRPAIVTQVDAASVSAATSTFNAQAASVSGINGLVGVSVAVSDSLNAGVVERTVTLNYTAKSQNAFLTALWGPTISLSGSSQATAKGSPNIDFYLLLDDSPSMAIAATPTGIQTMVNHTSAQSGCAFACHQKNPAADNLGNPGGEDNYTLARNLGVTLRIDLLRQATQNLMTTAQTTENADGSQYRMAIYTFDAGFNTIQTLTANLTGAQVAAGNINLLLVDHNNWLTSTNQNNDTDTNYDNAMNNVNLTMPAPGLGTNAQTDSPQEVLFFVTDGVEDESVSGARQQSLMDPGWCTKVKNRGIRIAVLYTTYLPLPTNAWYNQYISPFQTQIGPTLQTCASPQLYFEVQSGGDISAAMAALFQSAVRTAYLSK